MNQNVESFQPIESHDYITRKYDIIDELIDNEPEIITADPNAEEVRGAGINFWMNFNL